MGVAGDVVDALFEDQKDLAASISTQLYVLLVARRLKVKRDIAGAEYVAREAPHLSRQITQVVFAGVDRPDDIAHCVHELPRRFRNQRQRLFGLTIILERAQAGDFACHRDQGEVRSYIVVQVRCNTSPNSLEFDKLRDPIAVQRISQKSDENRGRGEEPPSLPDRGQYRE